MASQIFWLIRVAILGGVILFSIITLGLGAAYIAKIHSFSNAFVTYSAPAFAGLAVAISLISLLALTPLLVIDLIRKGAATSWILVELPVIGVISILWLATAADTASASLGIPLDCSAADAVSNDAGMLCHSYQGIEAFSFINWIFLKGYFITLLVVTLIAASRGNRNVWRSSVRETDFFARTNNTNVPMVQQDKPVVQPQYATPSPAPQAQYGTPQPYGTPAPQQGYAAQV